MYKSYGVFRRVADSCFKVQELFLGGGLLGEWRYLISMRHFQKICAKFAKL